MNTWVFKCFHICYFKEKWSPLGGKKHFCFCFWWRSPWAIEKESIPVHLDSFIFSLNFCSREKAPVSHCFLFLAGPSACGWSTHLWEQRLFICKKKLPVVFQVWVSKLELLKFGKSSRKILKFGKILPLFLDCGFLLVQFSLVEATFTYLAFNIGFVVILP